MTKTSKNGKRVFAAEVRFTEVWIVAVEATSEQEALDLMNDGEFVRIPNHEGGYWDAEEEVNDDSVAPVDGENEERYRRIIRESKIGSGSQAMLSRR